MIEEVQCISARCGDEYKILLIRVSNMRPIAGLRLQTELWESDNMAIDIIKDECKECGIYDYHVEFYDIDNEITWTNLGGKKRKRGIKRTSEEFVGKFTRRYDCPLFHLHNPNVITKGNALIAVEMARQEEREKAIKALDITLMAIIARGDNKVSLGKIRDKFYNLLNI